jgi:membrane protease YdiL (CAAX protease family)
MTAKKLSTSLRHQILSLTDTAETWVVLGVAFGYFIIQSVLRFLRIDGAPVFVALPLRYLAVIQLAILAAVALFLRARGWRLDDFGRKPRPMDVLLGIPLVVAAYLPFVILWWLFAGHSTLPIERGAPLDLSGLDIKTIVAAAFINSLFEEVLVVGYLVTSLRKRFSGALAIHASALIRLSYHVHQGATAVLSILPLGYVFAYWYARRRSLLPLVIAHTILDAIAFALYRIA